MTAVVELCHSMGPGGSGVLLGFIFAVGTLEGHCHTLLQFSIPRFSLKMGYLHSKSLFWLFKTGFLRVALAVLELML